MPKENPSPRRILRRRAVKELTGLPDATIHRLTVTGDFPKGVRITERSIGWFADEVTAWLESRPRVGSPEDPHDGFDHGDPRNK